MRQDQVDRLQDLSEKIAEVFLEEADPESWNGAGVPVTAMDQETRGNRLWDKKNAVQTGALLARVLDLRDRDMLTNRAPLDDGEVEADIKRHEKEARSILKDIRERSASKH